MSRGKFFRYREWPMLGGCKSNNSWAGWCLSLTVCTLHDREVSLLYREPLALILPDQHVAWRGGAWPTGGIFAKVTGRCQIGVTA